jgi:hypothetical protein
VGARDARAVVNIEVAGSHGPTMVLDLTAGNGRLVEAIEDGVPDPAAFSFLPVLWRIVPNGDDMQVFARDLGQPGVDLIGNLFDRAVYHTAHDNVASLDERSLTAAACTTGPAGSHVSCPIRSVEPAISSPASPRWAPARGLRCPQLPGPRSRAPRRCRRRRPRLPRCGASTRSSRESSPRSGTCGSRAYTAWAVAGSGLPWRSQRAGVGHGQPGCAP